MTTADEALDLSWRMQVAAGVNNLKRAVHGTAVDHGWWENGARNVGELLALVHSEVSEALEAYRDDQVPLEAINYEYPKLFAAQHGLATPSMYPEFEGTLGKPVGVASELADVIIRVLDMCEFLNIPITRALVEKHNYNLTRDYRHGGKLA